MKTVMTVDDSTTVRQAIKLALKDKYEVIEARSGQDALSKLDTKQIDLLITDLNMPNIDGVELIKCVRKAP